jgi:plasmid stabilization system protein ParE
VREYRVVWSPPAQEDVFDLLDYISADAPLNAMRVSERIDKSALSLRHFPHRGRRLPELTGDTRVARAFHGVEMRELLIKPWRLIYWIRPDRITIVALLDGRMDGVAWMDRHLPRLLKSIDK